MNRYKADLLDRFVSPRPAEVRAALRTDPAYRELKQRLDAIGFFAPAPWSYAWRIALCLGACAAGWAALVLGDAWWLRALGVLVVGVVMLQSSFLAHDAAHGALARRPWRVELIGQLHSTLISGFAFSYFRRGHDLHHFHTNEENVDPDCLSDLFSVDRWSASRKTGLGRFVTRYQGVLIPVLFPVWALAMKWDGLCFLARQRGTRDIAMMLAHAIVWLAIPWAVAGPLVAIGGYLAYNAIAGVYLGIVIPVNHVATTYLRSDHELSFLEQQLATCRNIRSHGRVFDYLFLGLNRQIEHHLFPWAPVCRLAEGAEVVRTFCVERGLPYNETGYTRAARDVAHHFAQVARVS